jgi:hypothetical protein
MRILQVQQAFITVWLWLAGDRERLEIQREVEQGRRVLVLCVLLPASSIKGNCLLVFVIVSTFIVNKVRLPRRRERGPCLPPATLANPKEQQRSINLHLSSPMHRALSVARNREEMLIAEACARIEGNGPDDCPITYKSR